MFGYVPLVTDLKGEYDRLCTALGVTPIRFMRGGHLRLNPLDPAVSGDARLALLRSIAELLLGRSLQPREDAALELASARLERTERRGQPTIGEVVTQLLRPDPQAAASLECSPEELTEWGRDLALALRRLLAGDLAGLFDEPTSPGLSLEGPMVSINLSQIPDQAKPILMACVATWLRGVWARRDGRRRIVVQEEAWHLLASPSMAEWQRVNFKLARQYGVQNILVMHHLVDLRAAGDAGTRTAELAAGLLADASTRVLYHLDQGEVRASADLLGLNQAQRQVVPRLQRGSGLWLVGQRAYVVHHLLGPSPDSPERWIVDTDQAMLGTSGPPAAAERVRGDRRHRRAAAGQSQRPRWRLAAGRSPPDPGAGRLLRHPVGAVAWRRCAGGRALAALPAAWRWRARRRRRGELGDTARPQSPGRTPRHTADRPDRARPFAVAADHRHPSPAEPAGLRPDLERQDLQLRDPHPSALARPGRRHLEQGRHAAGHPPSPSAAGKRLAVRPVPGRRPPRCALVPAGGCQHLGGSLGHGLLAHASRLGIARRPERRVLGNAGPHTARTAAVRGRQRPRSHHGRCARLGEPA